MKNKRYTPYTPEDYEKLFNDLCETSIAKALDWRRVEPNYFEISEPHESKFLNFIFDKKLHLPQLRFFIRKHDRVRSIIITKGDSPFIADGFSLGDKFFNCSVAYKYSMRFERIPNAVLQDHNVFYCKDGDYVGLLSVDALPTDIIIMRRNKLQHECGVDVQVAAVLRAIKRYFNLTE